MVFLFRNASGQAWKEYADTAVAYNLKGNTDKVIDFYTRSKEELKKDSAITTSYADICDSLAASFARKKQYTETELLYVEAKQIREKIFGKENEEYLRSCNRLVSIYFTTRQLKKAESALIEAKQIRQSFSGKDHPDYSALCINLGSVYVNLGEYTKAEPLFLEVKKIREKLLGKETAEYASSCNNLAALYFYTGAYIKAEPLYLEAKQIREKLSGKLHPEYAKYCNNLAVLYKNMGLFDKAELLYMEAKQIQEKNFGKENADYSASCNNLGVLYSDIGQYDKAEPLYLESMRIKEKLSGKQTPAYAGACNNLAVLYWRMGQYEQAELLYLEAKDIREKIVGKLHPDYAISCNNLAALYKDVKLYEKAESLYNDAKEIQEKVLGKQNSDYASTCNNLAIIYMDREEYERAELFYLEAKEIREKVLGKEHLDYAASCNNLSAIYQLTGQFKKAEQQLLEAKELRAKLLGKQHPDYASSCRNLAEVYWALHQPSMAEKELEESFSVDMNTVSTVFKFTNENEKAAYIKNILGEDDKAYSFYLSEKAESYQPYSISLFHRNLILSYAQVLNKQLYSTNDTALRKKYIEWLNYKKYLAVLYTRPFDSRKDEVTRIEAKAAELEKDINRGSSDFVAKHRQHDITPNEIQRSLKSNEAAIEFAEFQFYNGRRLTDSMYYVAIILRKDSPHPEMVKLFEKKQVEALLKTATTWTGIDSLYSSPALYDLVWQPLEKYLDNVSKVYYASAGLLHKINFAAVTSAKKIALSDKFQLVQLNTTSSIVKQQSIFISPTDKIAMYGGINFNADSAELKAATKQYRINSDNTLALRGFNISSDGLPDLPYSEEEVDYITRFAQQKKFFIKTLKGVEANEESVKALNGNESPVILHLATHGVFFPDPIKLKPNKSLSGGKAFSQSDNPLMRSMILLAGANKTWIGKPVSGIQDGVLTAYEISNLYFPNTKLVVLSACETGLGNIQGSEGVYGLQRSFKMAGVENLIMSLWSIPDNTTAEFMQLFYEHLFSNKSIRDSFTLAQSAMKNKYKSNPSRWAGLILVE